MNKQRAGKKTKGTKSVVTIASRRNDSASVERRAMGREALSKLPKVKGVTPIRRMMIEAVRDSGKTVAELARLAEIDDSALYRFMDGIRGNFYLSSFEKLAPVLGISIAIVDSGKKHPRDVRKTRAVLLKVLEKDERNQMQIAEAADVAQPIIFRFMTGERPNMTLDVFERLAPTVGIVVQRETVVA